MSPASEEYANLPTCLAGIDGELGANEVDDEIVVVDDGSQDNTPQVLSELTDRHPTLTPIRNEEENGFGRAVRLGFDHATGDAMVVMMADLSDSPKDLVRYWEKLGEGYDCVFGSRFIPGGRVIDYPTGKLIATCSHDHTMAGWDARTGLRQRVLRGPTNRAHYRAVLPLADAPDGKQLRH